MNKSEQVVRSGSDSIGNTADLDELEEAIWKEKLTEENEMSANKVEDQASLVITNNNKKASKKDKHALRPLARRSSVENIAWLGLMSPALTLVPTIDGHDSLTQTFSDLQGEHRELKLAAAHIDDALHGRGKYGKARAIFKSKTAQLCFKVIDNIWFQRFVLIFVVIHSGLIFWEPPSKSLNVPVAVLVLTPICLLVYTIDVILHIIFYTWPVFWSLSENKWMRIQFIFVCMYTIDFIVLVVQAFLPSIRLYQVFRAFRTAMLLCKLKNVAHIQDVLTSIIQKLVKVFLVICIFIILFAAFGVHSFMLEYSNKMDCGEEDCSVSDLRIYNGTFDNIAITSLRLIVLLSTDNFPDLMFPAYYTTPWYSLYFVIFEFLGVFLLTAILLAIIVDSYWVFSKRHVKEERKRERVEFAKAWNLLDPLGELRLNIHQDKFIQLFRLLKPKNTDKMNWKLIESLDDDDDSFINYTEWTTRLYDTLNFELSDNSQQKGLAKIPKWLKNTSSRVRDFVRKPWFVWFIFVLLVLHTVLFCLKWKGMSYSAELSIQILKTVIVAIFLVEMGLRILGENHKLLNRADIIDLLLILIAGAANIVWYITPEWRARGTNLSCLAVAFRIAFVNQTKNIKYAEILLKVIPIMYDLLLLIIAIIYFVAVVGFEAFFGIEPKKDVLTEASVYDYNCGIGFDQFSCSLLVIFQLILGVWADSLNAAIESTSTIWVCIYFVVCYVILVLAVMNLFIAIAYRAFQHATEREETIATQSSGQPDPPEAASRPASGVNRENDSNGSIIDLEKNEHQEEKEEEDLTGLSAKERKEKLMKKRLAEKKKGKQQHKKLEEFEVITAFKGLEIRNGDKVKILQKDGDIWEGLINGKQGWFPAYCVVDEEDELSTTIQTLGSNQKRNSLPGQIELDVPWRRGILGDMTVLNPEELREINKVVKSDRRSNQALRRGPSDREPKPRKITRRESGAEIPWRRGILGDMTVLNPEELKEINNIVKSGRRGSLSSKANFGSYGLSQSLPLPEVEETSESSKQDNEKDSTGGAMPSWALSFLGKNNLNASQDVKINDETILEEEEEESEGTTTQTTEL